ncbi:MAG: AAA family ATPase [Candidatus Methanomethylicaceae archaeon]|nr:AAA family ATPase [Candidatus Verstraetearchaeota archaeon]
MILRRLRIKNIRSYDEGEVNFPNGIILFEGDIGSGKSTLLLAIEFALFGLGNEKGTSLLSLGKNEGEVELEFELKNKRVKVHRSLIRSRKKGGISQEDCWIEIDGRRMLLSPTEMKEKILEILGYNEPADPKAKSVIFRYAIYTPQEEMKEILNRPVDERLQTIRKALRLEDYKIARDNALTIAKELKIHAKLLLEEEKKIPDLENEKKKLLQEKEENFKKIEELENNLLDIEISIKGLESEAEILREEIEKLIGEAKRGEEIEKTIEDFKKKIEDLRNRINNDKQKSNNLKKQKDEILKIIKKPEKDLEIIENELSEVRKEKNKILEEVAKKDHLLSTYISLVERKVCPTCNQRVDHEEFLSRVNNLRIELDEINRKKKEIELNIEKLELMKKEAEEYKLLSMRLSNIEESILILEERILKDEEELNNLLKRNEELKEELKIAKEAADNYRKKKIELEKISNEIKKLMEKRRDLENKKSKLIADMEKLQLSINNLDQEINKIKEKANKGKRLLEYTTWLEECFIPALEKIEVTIFRDANREFNEEFSRFFSFMVDDPSKSVMIDEEFTPIVMQESYEQDISNLSGGERTALALAFRLALNKIVQKRAGIEGGLLILDEPTDGLSKEQIGKIGDLIRELGLNQVIIVSHERELEGAVDHIFRVQKENGKSKVILTRG